jgi:pyruvate dehydrogenase E1 component
MNENYSHPEKPKGCDDGILKGMYLFKEGKNKGKTKGSVIRLRDYFTRNYSCI